MTNALINEPVSQLAYRLHAATPAPAARLIQVNSGRARSARIWWIVSSLRAIKKGV